ncbi:TAXI family TRAP transporter solute-binding subunit [Lysinibacillus fusiformis]|nr:TAXI family TRAP transporter solute-binding subunit [Lysinibacillus fusiformis]
MKAFKVLKGFLVLTLAIFLAACGSAEGNSGDSSSPKFLTIGTASSGSSLYLYGTSLADLLKNNISGTQFDVEETGGSLANINLIESSEIEVGLTTATTIEAAIKEGDLQNVSLGWNIEPTVVHFVSDAKDGYTSLSDLANKNIAIGPSGSAANQLAIDLLENHGVDTSKVQLTYAGWPDAMEALADGAVDAALVLGTVPAPVIEGFGVQNELTILNLEEDKLTDLLLPYVIDSNTYSGQAEASNTAADNMYILFSKDLSEDFVYELTKLAMEGTETLAKTHPMGGVAEAPPAEEIEKLGLELHPGVMKYLKEIGEY